MDRHGAVTPEPASQTQPPEPDFGWSHDLLHLENAQVFPPERAGFVQAAGIRDADGKYCPQGALWRHQRPLMTPPEQTEPPDQRLAGTWLWGGILRDHFGHFLTESTTRLWALPGAAERLDGILFIPKRPARQRDLLAYQRDFLALLQPETEGKLVSVPTVVERLIVPGQGFGLGRIASGTVPFRQAFGQHFAQHVSGQGEKRLYISRSKLRQIKGGVIGEAQIEAQLAEHGYDIFHPQEHDIETQIARYKAAEQILAVEGSALHLLAMVARPHQRIGIMLRRRSGTTKSITRHIKFMAGRKPVTLDPLIRLWRRGAGSRGHSWLGEYDMGRLQTLLEQHAFIEASGVPWQTQAEEDTRRNLGPAFELVTDAGPKDAQT